MPKNLESRLRKIAAREGHYHVNAYRFVYEALDHTIKTLGRPGHVTGRELLEGIRDLAIEQFGGLSLMVLDNWGVRKTGDWGDIVFTLVEEKLMGRTESDSREDFDDVYDFRKVFSFDATTGTGRAP